MAIIRTDRNWSYEDLVDLPDDGKRYEIHNGELYELPAPNGAHRTVLANLIELLLPHVHAAHGVWRPAATALFLTNNVVVEPDLLIQLSDGRWSVGDRGVDGPPDLIVEILSPSYPGRDRIRKRALYAGAGVREYWIADPYAGSIEVLALDERGEYQTHRIAGDDARVSSTLLPDVSFEASAAYS
ncbi:MAG: Uma2 family endonuclease [Chloroflexia bacterium]